MIKGTNSDGLEVMYLQDIDDIIEMAHQKRAVKWNGASRPVSAAFILNMTVRTFNGLLNKGMWLHEPKKLKKKPMSGFWKAVRNESANS